MLPSSSSLSAAGADNGQQQRPSYSTFVGLIYVFNLIVGNGALALPKAVQDAGWLLGLLLLFGSCIVSYICASFVIECMAIANAVLESERMQRLKRAAHHAQQHDHHHDGDEYNSDDEIGYGDDGDEQSPLLHDIDADSIVQPRVKDHCFDIVERVELSRMAYMFFGKTGVALCYIVLTVYLLGDLAIYSAAVPKSLMNVICSHDSFNFTVDDPNEPCRHGWTNRFNTRFDVYRLVVICFTLLVGPFIMVGITRTKYLQLSTTISRWTAFLLMIGLASAYLFSSDRSPDERGHPDLFHFGKFGQLYGVIVYAFMCHHSLPGVITPMRRKQNVHYLLLTVFLLICGFYMALALTGAFAFKNVQDVYTLNFFNTKTGNWLIMLIDYFLALFPVFTLSTNYPIVGITLKNNLLVLQSLACEYIEMRRRGSDDSSSQRAVQETDNLLPPTGTVSDPSTARRFVSKIVIPLIVIIIPATIALITDNVLFLASITGSYAGVGVQFLIPSLLVFYARRHLIRMFGQNTTNTNASPFRSQYWLVFMLLWSSFTVIVVTTNLFHIGK